MIVNSDGKFLVLTNSYLDVKPELAYAPDFPGGTLEPGETEVEALVRETKEELGIDISHAPIKKITQCGSPDQGFVVTLYLVWANIRDVNLSEEHCMFSWLTLEQMRRLPWWGGYQQLFRNMELLLTPVNGREFAEYTQATFYAAAEH